MKTLFVTLFSVLLLGAQTVFTAESLCPDAPVKASCACRNCHKPSCCSARSTPVPKTPAVPAARGYSQYPFQFLAPAPARSLSLDIARAGQSPVTSSPSLQRVALPLYARTCRLLL